MGSNKPSRQNTPSPPPNLGSTSGTHSEENACLLPPSRQTPNRYHQPGTRAQQIRKFSTSSRSVSGRSLLGFGGYGATDDVNPVYQPARVTKEGQKRVLTTIPIVANFWALVLAVLLSVVTTILLAVNVVWEFDVPQLPPKSNGFVEFWISAVGSWIGLAGLFFFSHPSYLFFVASLIACLLLIPITLLASTSPSLQMAYWPFFLVPLIPAATTIFLSLLANYLVRRAKWLESMRILRALTTHGREDTWARAWYGLRERGCWGGFLRLIRGIAGFISGLAGVTVVVLLLVDMCITAYDGTTPLPSPSSKMVTVSPPSSPSSVKVHLACVEPGNATENIGRFPYRRHDLPTILYEAPSGVPGSLAILNPAVSLNNDDIPGRWIFEMQEKGEVGRVCIWDRPGYGFSEVLPRADLGDVVDALWLALEQAEVTKNIKFVLVGEGYGGLLTRVFASRHPSSIHSYLHLEAQTSLTYFSPPRGDFAGPKLLLHRLSTRVLPSILTPLSITRLPSLLLRRSTSISRILASTYTQTSQLNGNLRKALLQETFSSHTHQSASFAALLHSADSYPIRPAVVLSSAERMKDLKWAEGQEALAREVSQEGLIKWEKVEGVGHFVCQGQGKGICKEALRTLYAS